MISFCENDNPIFLIFINRLADFFSKLLTLSYPPPMHRYIMASRFFGKLRLKRITIVIDQKTETKLRQIQGHIIAKEKKNYSFSKTVNTILLAGISQMHKLTSTDWEDIRSYLEKKEFEYEPLVEKQYSDAYTISSRYSGDAFR